MRMLEFDLDFLSLFVLCHLNEFEVNEKFRPLFTNGLVLF
jgi:hypothetical protein